MHEAYRPVSNNIFSNNAYTTYNPPERRDPDILFQDDHVLIVQKPAGLLSVPGNSPEKQDCMLSRCMAEHGELHVAHRLDMSTSGIILFARNKEALRGINRQFADREVDKTYTAVVDGLVEHDCGRIDAPIAPDWANRPRQRIDPAGRASLTRYQVINKNSDTTRLKLIPVTGRSHQLRLHLFSIGHAILGDELYAPDRVFDQAERLLLHATALSFSHPVTDERISIECPAPF